MGVDTADKIHPKYIYGCGGLCDTCYDEELFKSGSLEEKKEPGRFSQNKNAVKSLHVFLCDESLVHFHLAPRQTILPALLLP